MSGNLPALKPPAPESRAMSEPAKPPLAGIDIIKVGSILVGLALAWAALDARSQQAQLAVADHEARLRVIEREVLSSLARIEQQLLTIERAKP